MTQSPNTKVTQPQDDPRETGAVIDGECYIKSTVKTSTWEVSTHKTQQGGVCSAVDSGANGVQFDNVDWDVSGMYAGFTGSKRPFKMVESGFYKGHDILPLGEESYRTLVDWDLNPNMDLGVNSTTNRDQWEFNYVEGNDDKTFPYTQMIKPKTGQSIQYVIKFKEPVNVPAQTKIHWWFNQQNHFTNALTGGVMNGPPINYGNSLTPGGAGGFFTEPNINKLNVNCNWWTGSKCGCLAYFRNGAGTSTYVDWKEEGLRDVYWMISPILMLGCGPTFVTAPHLGLANFRQVALGFTSLPDILTEGIDF